MYYLLGALLITIGVLLFKVATPRPGGAHRGTRDALRLQQEKHVARVATYEQEIRRRELIIFGIRDEWTLV